MSDANSCIPCVPEGHSQAHEYIARTPAADHNAGRRGLRRSERRWIIRIARWHRIFGTVEEVVKLRPELETKPLPKRPILHDREAPLSIWAALLGHCGTCCLPSPCAVGVIEAVPPHLPYTMPLSHDPNVFCSSNT